MTQHQNQIEIPDPRQTPTLGVEQAGELMGIGRTLAYDLARQDAFPVPVLRLGTLYKIPTAPLLAALGLTPNS